MKTKKQIAESYHWSSKDVTAIILTKAFKCGKFLGKRRGNNEGKMGTKIPSYLLLLLSLFLSNNSEKTVKHENNFIYEWDIRRVLPIYFNPDLTVTYLLSVSSIIFMMFGSYRAHNLTKWKKRRTDTIPHAWSQQQNMLFSTGAERL